MWFAYFIGYIVMCSYTVLQTPKEWWTAPKTRIGLILFHIPGFSSLLVMILFFHRLPNGPLRTGISLIETIYFSFLAFSCALCLIRQFIYYTLRHFNLHHLNRFLASRQLFLAFVYLFTLCFLFAGTKHMEHLKETHYQVTIPSSTEIPDMKIALVSDFHIGAGATPKLLSEMVEIINNMQADLVVISGDISDLQSSREDLEILTENLKLIRSRHGIYYAEGNHEAECHYSCLEYLEEAQVHVLENQAVLLPEGVALIGRCDQLDQPIKTILNASDLHGNTPRIVLQHRPQKLRDIRKDCDLVLCGHTHGYQYPFLSIIWPFFYDLCYGQEQFGDMTAITTSGISAWGYHAKWPSYSEVVEIDLHFQTGSKSGSSSAEK